MALIVMLLPLSALVSDGLLEITLMRYPEPPVLPAGMVTEILPEFAVLVNVPKVVGDANEPLELDNCAVYTFPLLNVPVEVNGTLKLDEPVVVVTQYGP